VNEKADTTGGDREPTGGSAPASTLGVALGGDGPRSGSAKRETRSPPKTSAPSRSSSIQPINPLRPWGDGPPPGAPGAWKDDGSCPHDFATCYGDYVAPSASWESDATGYEYGPMVGIIGDLLFSSNPPPGVRSFRFVLEVASTAVGGYQVVRLVRDHRSARRVGRTSCRTARRRSNC
jgi:hypothetical protein